MVYSANFLSKRAEVASSHQRSNIDAMLRTMELMPGVGSSLVAETVHRRYGANVLKALVSPYVIVYEYDRDQDTLYVYDLLYAQAIH